MEPASFIRAFQKILVDNVEDIEGDHAHVNVVGFYR
jgi:hypothetical protein